MKIIKSYSFVWSLNFPTGVHNFHVHPILHRLKYVVAASKTVDVDGMSKCCESIPHAYSHAEFNMHSLHAEVGWLARLQSCIVHG